LLIPGLGDHRVSSESIGLSTAFWVYGSLGAGAYFWIGSRYYYNKYHEATVQTDMDEYYTVANLYHYASGVFFAIATTIWLYDIYWVYNEGQRNAAARKSRYGFNYNPNLRAVGVSYALSF